MSVLRDIPEDQRITPRGVAAYLGSSGWDLAVDEQDRQFWTLAEGGGTRASLLLPMDADYDDFELRFDEVLKRLQHVYDWDLQQLVTSILGARSDFLYIRANQSTTDGSIPLVQAEGLLSGAGKMLEAAACAALNPRANYAGRKPNAVREFVNEDIRMGHTLRGSFVITILTRLDEDEVVVVDAPGLEVAADAPAAMEKPMPPAETPNAGTTEGMPPTALLAPFQRRVMSALASGLDATRALAVEAGDLTPSLDQAVTRGVSADLVAALSNMTRFEGLRSLDLSFGWAPAERVAPPAIERVDIDHVVMPRLPLIRERLERRPPEPATVTIYGQVVRLERGDVDDTDGGGEILVRGIIGKTTRQSVRIALDRDDYSRAIQAHGRRRTVSATGERRFEKGHYWLRGDVHFEVTEP